MSRYQMAPCLRRRLGAATLVHHEGRPWFTLVPDFLLTHGDRTMVLDTKWKRIDQRLGNAADKYGLSQTDFYQMYAYGQRYLSGDGEIVLLYPRTSTFDLPLPVFEFSDALRLWVVPFDLETGRVTAFDPLLRGSLVVPS